MTEVDVDRCPACASPERTLLFRTCEQIHGIPGSFTLMHCERCGSVYPDPRPDADSLAAFYPSDGYHAYRVPLRHSLFARRDPVARAWYSTRRGVLSRDHGYDELKGSALLAGTVGRLPVLRGKAEYSLGPRLHPWTPAGTLLDIGCGSGTYLDLMRALGWRVVGVDMSATAAERAREVLELEVHVGDVREVGLDANTFDAVTMSHTLEHVDDPVAVLAEVRRITREDGRIALVVPNARSLGARFLGPLWQGFDTPRHLINFSPAGLTASVEAAGLRVESLTTFSRAPYRALKRFVCGDEIEGMPLSDHHSSASRRVAIASLAALECACWGLGAAVGEEIWLVARR